MKKGIFMNELIKFLLKPYIKAVVLGVFTLAISILTSVVTGASAQWTWWVVLISLCILNIIVLAFYAKGEADVAVQISDLERKNIEEKKLFEVFQHSTQGLTALCKMSAKQTNMKVHEIEEQGKIFCDNWNFDIASGLVCQQIYNQVICHLCDENAYNGIVDIEVGYVTLVENKPKKDRKPRTLIKLCGFYHPSRPNPSLYGKTRESKQKGKDKRIYHDGMLFEAQSNAVDILMTKEEIIVAFGSLSASNDYCQYVGIPVFCDTVGNGNKMIGLLEIVCHNDCYLSNSKEDIKKYVDFYLSPYVSLLLFLFKNDKALRAMPNP